MMKNKLGIHEEEDKDLGLIQNLLSWMKVHKADSDSANHKVIVSDGVFSMDGTYAKLDKIVELAEKYDALIMLDDCHATGFVGENGRGTAEHFGLEGKVDILTSTLGKALGGASGGFVCAKENVIKLLKQRSRPYLFSNALSPSIVSASLKALEIIKDERKKRIFIIKSLETVEFI